MRRLLSAMRVAVIGGGAAGLCALRHLAARPQVFQAVAFEQTENIGGTWVYTDETGYDRHGLPVHSSMYKNLRTNLPKEVMAFPDTPFSPSLPSFVSHSDVREYLEKYADKYDIKKYIEFSSVVERVHPVQTAEGDKWHVTVRRLRESPHESCDSRHKGLDSRGTYKNGVDSKENGVGSSETSHMEFDAVMICNGHYSVPLIPALPGRETFRGVALHSHEYRDPAAFTGRRVVCLGAGASGQDIILDMAKQAKQIYLAHRRPPLKAPLPSNVQQVPGIQELRGDSVILEDGSSLEVDALLYCTGYHYTYPFLSPAVCLHIKDGRVTPLYKHLLHTHHPSLAIVGVPKTICPFPQFDLQVRFFLSTLDGSTELPSRAEMEADTEADFEWRLSQGMPARHAHHMGPLQWGYNTKLAQQGGLKDIPPAVQNLYEHVHGIRRVNLMGYKEMNFKLENDTDFVQT